MGHPDATASERGLTLDPRNAQTGKNEMPCILERQFRQKRSLRREQKVVSVERRSTCYGFQKVAGMEVTT